MIMVEVKVCGVYRQGIKAREKKIALRSHCIKIGLAYSIVTVGLILTVSKSRNKMSLKWKESRLGKKDPHCAPGVTPPENDYFSSFQHGQYLDDVSVRKDLIWRERVWFEISWLFSECRHDKHTPEALVSGARKSQLRLPLSDKDICSCLGKAFLLHIKKKNQNKKKTHTQKNTTPI